MKNNFNNDGINISVLALKFSKIVLIIAIMYSAVIVLFALYKILFFEYQLKYYIFLAFGVILSIIFGFVLKLNESMKVNISILIFSVFISVYSIEVYLFYKSTISKKISAQDQLELLRQEEAKKMGIPYDTRTVLEFLGELSNSGKEAYTNVLPSFLVESDGLNSNNQKIFPFGGISNITTTFPVESGFFPIIETDEHGFNNPKGLYKKGKVDIVLIGDSAVEGHSVHADENISAVIRESGYNSISLGRGENGPLLEYAILKEYGEPIKPKLVLWFNYFDFYDIRHEMESSFLRKYLTEDDFSQNLIARQDEIDNVLKDYTKEQILNYLQTKSLKNNFLQNLPIIRLNNIRTTITNINQSKSNELKYARNFSDFENEIEIYRKILIKTKSMVSEWGGKLYIVHYPSIFRYIGDDYPDFYEEWLKTMRFENDGFNFIKNTAKELDIPLIDLHREVFLVHSDPLSLFPFRLFGHYNAKGFRLVAEAIVNRLEEDGFQSIKLNN